MALTHSCGNRDHSRWKRQPSHLCHHIFWYTLILYGLITLFCIFFMYTGHYIGYPFKDCGKKFILHSQNLSGPLHHNICWIHEFFLWASCSNPPSWVIQIQYYIHISLFFSSLCSGKKTENTINPVMKINFEFFFCFSQRPNKSQMLSSHFQYWPTQPAKTQNKFQDRITIWDIILWFNVIA